MDEGRLGERCLRDPIAIAGALSNPSPPEAAVEKSDSWWHH